MSYAKNAKWEALPIIDNGDVVAFSIVDIEGNALLIGRRQETPAETKAIMDLAAAAPELFEALRIIANRFEDAIHPVSTEARTRDEALAALAKARGEN